MANANLSRDPDDRDSEGKAKLDRTGRVIDVDAHADDFFTKDVDIEGGGIDTADISSQNIVSAEVNRFKAAFEAAQSAFDQVKANGSDENDAQYVNAQREFINAKKEYVNAISEYYANLIERQNPKGVATKILTMDSNELEDYLDDYQAVRRIKLKFSSLNRIKEILKDDVIDKGETKSAKLNGELLAELLGFETMPTYEFFQERIENTINKIDTVEAKSEEQRRSAKELKLLFREAGELFGEDNDAEKNYDLFIDFTHPETGGQKAKRWAKKVAVGTAVGTTAVVGGTAIGAVGLTAATLAVGWKGLRWLASKAKPAYNATADLGLQAGKGIFGPIYSTVKGATVDAYRFGFGIKADDHAHGAEGKKDDHAKHAAPKKGFFGTSWAVTKTVVASPFTATYALAKSLVTDTVGLNLDKHEVETAEGKQKRIEEEKRTGHKHRHSVLDRIYVDGGILGIAKSLKEGFLDGKWSEAAPHPTPAATGTPANGIGAAPVNGEAAAHASGHSVDRAEESKKSGLLSRFKEFMVVSAATIELSDLEHVYKLWNKTDFGNMTYDEVEDWTSAIISTLNLERNGKLWYFASKAGLLAAKPFFPKEKRKPAVAPNEAVQFNIKHFGKNIRETKTKADVLGILGKIDLVDMEVKYKLISDVDRFNELAAGEKDHMKNQIQEFLGDDDSHFDELEVKTLTGEILRKLRSLEAVDLSPRDKGKLKGVIDFVRKVRFVLKKERLEKIYPAHHVATGTTTAAAANTTAAGAATGAPNAANP